MNPWVKLALQVGVPSVIALFLVQQLAINFNSKLDSTTELLRTHTATTIAIADRLLIRDSQFERLVALTFAQCVNAAKSSTERNECVRAGQ